MKGLRRARSKVLGLLLTALFLVLPAAVLAAQVKDLPKPTDYVSDFAHVLSPQAIARIDSICAQLDHSKANAQIAVVTIPSLDGDDSAEYATDLYSEWGIGKKGTDRGVLFLFAIQDHRRSIKVGYGLEGILPDAKTGDIGRSMIPLLRANNFDGAVLLGVSQTAQVIAEDAGVTLENRPVPQPYRQVQHHISVGTILFLIFLLVFFVGSPLMRLLLGYSVLTSGWRGGGFGGGPWIGGGGDGGGFGGGDSGGGGGFGGFGGGDTGGGGSDGSW
jgi:uncharacterized protein